MGVERQGSKSGGGYVGGFLHLFDWNTKSRKKLFSSKSDLSEQSKQNKRNEGNFPMTRLHLMDQDESFAGSSIKGSSDYSCASSVIDEEVGGSKAPGVVAKLMGLDSLPTSNFSEANSTPFFDSQSLRDAHYYKKKDDFQRDHVIVHSGNLHSRSEDPIRDTMESKLQKIVSRPIEKFQTEVLPPKLAKSIPITHNKLLSPIKSGGYFPSKNAVHIMEAAAKIIESGNQVSTKAKMPMVGSSVPLKFKDLKEKMEAAKKSKLSEACRESAESAAAKHIKGQPMNKNWNGSSDTKSFRASSDLEACSVGLKNKGKSISLAVQAKVNVQKREGMTPNGSKSSIGQKERGEIMSSQIFKSQPSIQRSSLKKPCTNNSTSVLRQNNQKQNCLTERGKAPSKSSSSGNSQGRKVMSGESSLGRQRNSGKNSKVGSRKLGCEETDDGKEFPYNSTSVTRKKRCIDGDFNFQKNQVNGNNEKNGKAVQHNGLLDRKFSLGEDNKRNSMDVVSFTFTAPMTRSSPATETSRELTEKNSTFLANFQGKNVFFNSGLTDGSKLYLLGGNKKGGGDALSNLLEQKIRELTLGLESSRHKAETAGSSASYFPEQATASKAGATSPERHVKNNKTDDQWGSAFSSTNYEGIHRKFKLQGVEEMFDCGSSDSEFKNLVDGRHPSPISILEPNVFTESCNSSDTFDSYCAEGSKQCSSSVRAVFHMMEVDADLSDSASSSSARVVATQNVTSVLTDSVGSTRWELEYVKKIICNIEIMFKDFACGRTSKMIDPLLFHQLETYKTTPEGGPEDELKQDRKVVFDCVEECLDLRFRQYVSGGSKAWAKGLSMVRRKDRLAEEVFKEISGWEAMRDCMVDELVDKDMSSHYGKWLDFEVEAFEMGIEIEGRILNSLLNEVISDILVL